MDRREEICQRLGYASVLKAHEAIVSAAKRPSRWLLQQGLNAKTLLELGYNAVVLEKMGFAPDILAEIGFGPIKSTTPAPLPTAPPLFDTDDPAPSDIRALVEAGHKADQLKALSIRVHHCKKAGLSASELHRAGFPVNEIASCCSGAEMRRAGFRPTELRSFFNGPELRASGYSADEMRLAGYSIRDLLSYGYNENHIRSAGFCINDLMAAGLSKHVQERKF